MIVPATILPSELKDHMISLRKPFASANEISGWLGCEPKQVSTRLRRVRESGNMVCVTKGGWAVAYDGSPRASEYLGPMMDYLGCQYYIGGQSAARLLGVHTHSLSKWTVMASSPLRNREIGRHHLRFVSRPFISLYPIQHKRIVYPDYGIRYHKLSTPEITLFDTIQLGVSDLVANVIGKMLMECGLMKSNPSCRDMLDPAKLKEAAWLYPISARQRSGYMIAFMLSWLSAWIDNPLDLGPLLSTIPKHAAPVNLFNHTAEIPKDQCEHDHVWGVRVNGKLDPDI